MQPFKAITKGPNESFVHVSGVSDDFGRDAADKTLSSERRARTKSKQLCFPLSLPRSLSASLGPSLLSLLYLSVCWFHLPHFVCLSRRPPVSSRLHAFDFPLIVSCIIPLFSIALIPFFVLSFFSSGHTELTRGLSFLFKMRVKVSYFCHIFFLSLSLSSPSLPAV